MQVSQNIHTNLSQKSRVMDKNKKIAFFLGGKE
jgi:hypothetical protein